MAIRLGLAAGLVGSLLLFEPARAEPILPAAGAYEVEVRLELPHLDQATAHKTAKLCLTMERGSNNHGLIVLSDNNPLARCPISDVREDGARLTFAIACQGRNAAKASASYEFAPDNFRGRITMNMGGKNMTMTEYQAGRRIGACEGQPPTQ